MKTLKLWREVTLGGVFAAGEGEEPVKARYTLSAESIARHDALNDQLIEAAEAKRGQRKTQSDINDHYRMRLDAVLSVLLSIEFQLEEEPGVVKTIGLSSPELRNTVFLTDLEAGYTQAILDMKGEAQEMREKFAGAESGTSDSEAHSEP